MRGPVRFLRRVLFEMSREDFRQKYGEVVGDPTRVFEHDLSIFRNEPGEGNVSAN